MLSYQWDNQKEVLRIKESLESRGYKIWMDIENMQENIYKSMSEGIEGASLGHYLYISKIPRIKKLQ